MKQSSTEARPWSALRRHLQLAIGMLLVTLVTLQLLTQSRPRTEPLLERLESFPEQVGAWQGIEEGWGSERVAALEVDDWMLRSYRHPSGPAVWLYVGVSDDVSFSGGTSPHSPSLCYPAQGWELVDFGLQEIEAKGVHKIAINKLLVQKGPERRLVLYWIQWGREIATESAWGDYAAKLTRLARIPSLVLQNRRRDTALVRISAPVTGSVDETLANELDFLEQAFPLLARHFALRLRLDPES